MTSTAGLKPWPKMARILQIGNVHAPKVLMSSHSYPQGFTYIGLLIVIAIAGIGLAAVGVLWQTQAQRMREQELLFIGGEYSRALASYATSTPGGIRQFPADLEDLVLDKRIPIIKRHLRKLYLDPISNKAEWGLEKQQNRIVGVYSLSKKKPIKKSGFAAEYESFENAQTYSDWRFGSSGNAGNGIN